MLIIAHRGSRESHHENTLASLREAIRIDADMIEFDVRLTKDNIPVLSHDLRLYGTKRRELALLRRYTYAELEERTRAGDHPLINLDEALAECFDKIYINIEIKEVSAVKPTLDVISRYATKKKDWDSIMISSFKPLALRAVRKLSPHVALGMLQYRNPLLFLAWHRVLSLSAVGFHRLYITTMALEAAKRLGLFTYVYTVNRHIAAMQLAERGIDGIVTDFPSKMLQQLDLKDKD